jgi:hypothetical protein
MLTHVPTEKERALLTVGQWGSRWTRTRILVAAVTTMHLFGAFTLLAAPDAQLFTQGARPALNLLPPLVWSGLFLMGGLGGISLLHRYTGPRQFVTWLFVIPTQIVWVAASAFAVLNGHGGAMSMVFLPALLFISSATALWVFWDFITGKR